MPIPSRVEPTYDGSSVYCSDTYSISSQATSNVTFGDRMREHLVRRSAKKGFVFNIMSVGDEGLGQTNILSALFDKNLTLGQPEAQIKDPLNPAINIDTKTFEIEDKKVKLKLTIGQTRNYLQALCQKNTERPLVDYIDTQFADYHKREFSDRKSIQDKMIHCMFLFISPIGHGLSMLDLELLKAVHKRVNVILVIARAEALTLPERIAFKQRVKDDLRRNNIEVYQMPDPDEDDSEEMKREIKKIQDAMPFAVTSISSATSSSSATASVRSDSTFAEERCLGWCKVDPYNEEHSDFLLLKAMLHWQMSELRDLTHEIFYEDYRLSKRTHLPERFDVMTKD